MPSATAIANNIKAPEYLSGDEEQTLSKPEYGLDESAQLSSDVNLEEISTEQNLEEHQALVNHASNLQGPSADLVARAKELLLVPDSKIKSQIPKTLLFGLKKGLLSSNKALDEIQDSYIRRRKFVLEAIARGQTIVLNSDFDGTVAYKNPVKVNNTRSIASINDMHWLRQLTKGLHRAGGVFVINTARPGVFGGPSIVSPEGDGGHRIPEEISGVLEELGIFDLNDSENHEILQSLQINGFNTGISHVPFQPLKIKKKVKQYIGLIDKLNQVSLPNAPNGLVAEIEKISGNQEEKLPLRILEYKAIPRYFLDQEDAYFSDYVSYISLVQKSRKEKWDSHRFIAELKNAKIKLPEKHKELLDPGDPYVEQKLTAVIRDGKIACMTPHAIDADNVERLDKQSKLLQTFVDFCRSEEAQEWAFKEHGIPKGTDLLTINGKSIKHIKRFTSDNFESLLKDLKANGSSPENSEHVIIDVKFNFQPYVEVAPNAKKEEGLKGFNDAIKTNEFVIAAGDSESTDGPLLAQALINGGIAFKVRGLMDEESIVKYMVELLSESRNSNHEYAFEKIDEHTFKRVSTGEVKTKNEWTQVLLSKYKDRILSAEHIHLNNAMNAFIFSEIFPDLKFDADPKAKWFKEAHKNANKRTLLTPVVASLERDLDDKAKFPDFKKNLYDKLPAFIKNIPGVKALLDVKNAPSIFNVLLGVVSNALMGAGAMGVIAKFTGHQKLMQAAKLIERVAYGVNNVASGIGRGLRQSIIFPNQFWGEMLGLMSSFMPLNNTLGQTLRALSNVILIGRANEVIMRENCNLDTFAKGKRIDIAVNETFGKHKNEWANIRKPAAKLTKKRMDLARSLENSFIGKIPIFGRLIALTIADLNQSWSMFWQFLKVPALRKGALTNIAKPNGIPKMSKNSGKEYQNVHSPAHLYNFVGVTTLLTSVASFILGKVTGNKKLDQWLTNIANVIPGFGIVAAARLLEQDAAGDPRQFTSATRANVKFTPEKAGFWQRIGGLGQSLAAMFLHTDVGQLLFNMSTGAYLKGIQYELPIRLDDSAINERRRTGEGFTHENYDTVPKHQILDFVRNFHSPDPSLEPVGSN